MDTFTFYPLSRNLAIFVRDLKYNTKDKVRVPDASMDKYV